jgi:exopolysaccharide production protein ExoQ
MSYSSSSVYTAQAYNGTHASPAFRPFSAIETAARWLIYIPLIFFAARGTFSFEFAAGSSGVDPSIQGPGARQASILGSVILPLAAYGIVFLLIKSRWREVLQLARQCPALVVLGLLPSLSALWSQNPSRSLVFGICYFVDTLFAFFLACEIDPDQLPVLMNRLLLVLSISCILLVVFVPSVGIESADPRFGTAWRGLFDQRGGSGRVTLYLLTASLTILPRFRTKLTLLAILLGFVVLTNAHAVSAWVVFSSYCAYLALQSVNRSLSPRSSTAFLLMCAVVVGGALTLFVTQSDTILPLIGRDSTLTGRTDVWHLLLPSVAKRPFLGYGFYSFWLGLVGESEGIARQLHWIVGYAHNGFLEVTLQLGLVGLGWFLVTLIQALRNTWQCLRYDKSRRFEWYAGIILMTLIFNVYDCSILWPKDLLSILYVVACCQLALRAKSLRVIPAPAT